MNWHERILESWPLRGLVTLMLTFLWSALLIRQWSFALDSCMIFIGGIIVYNLREYIVDTRAGVSDKHDFVGWLVLTIAVSAILSAVMNSLLMMGKL